MAQLGFLNILPCFSKSHLGWSRHIQSCVQPHGCTNRSSSCHILDMMCQKSRQCRISAGQCSTKPGSNPDAMLIQMAMYRLCRRFSQSTRYESEDLIRRFCSYGQPDNGDKENNIRRDTKTFPSRHYCVEVALVVGPPSPIRIASPTRTS